MNLQNSVYKDLANEGRFLINRENPSSRAMRRFLDRALVADLNFYFATWNLSQQQQMLAKLKDVWVESQVPGVAVKLYIDTSSTCLPFEKYTSDHNVSVLRIVVSRWRQVYDEVGNRYTLSNKEWVHAVDAFVSACLTLHRVLVQVNDFLSEPTYTYRGLPCTCVHESALWTVCGQDRRGGSGVLEWATSQADAVHLKSLMDKEPNRFVQVTCSRYLEVDALHPDDLREVSLAVFINNAPMVAPYFEGLTVNRTFGKEQIHSGECLYIGQSYWVTGPRYKFYELAAAHSHTFFSTSPVTGDWFSLT